VPEPQQKNEGDRVLQETLGFGIEWNDSSPLVAFTARESLLFFYFSSLMRSGLSISCLTHSS
jgi:hypothetical protein